MHLSLYYYFFCTEMAAICDLPIEMRLEILEKLSLHELVVNSSKTCHQWRDDIAQHILAPKILALAEVNEKFKMDIKEKGWAEEQANNPTELLMSLYKALFIYNTGGNAVSCQT